MAAKATKDRLRRIAEDAISVLEEDPKRFKALLRSVAELADEAALLLDEAAHDTEAAKARLLSKSLRGAAYLPAGLAAALARKLLGKALGAG
jgi:hypothetical protein